MRRHACSEDDAGSAGEDHVEGRRKRRAYGRRRRWKVVQDFGARGISLVTAIVL